MIALAHHPASTPAPLARWDARLRLLALLLLAVSAGVVYAVVQLGSRGALG